jgi:hypothetical protein
MKGLKIVGFILAGLVVLLGIAVALALMPSVQTWAVRKAVAGKPMELNVAHVAAGFSAADLNDVRFVKDGMVVTVKGVSAKYNAWDYITKKRINADSVTIDEVVLDLRNAKPAAAPTPAAPSTTPPRPSTSSPSATASSKPAKKEPFEGLLKEAHLPFDVRIANLSAKGRALLPNNQIVTFDLKGAGIETGQRGKLEWTIDFADSTSGAALRGLRATGNANVRIATDRRIDSIEVETTAAAMGPKLSADPIRLNAKAEKPTPTGDESYAASVNLVKAGAAEPLLKTNAQFISSAREITGGWELAVRTEQLAGLLTGLGVPELSAKGAGKFSFKPDNNAVAASGNLEAQSSQLQKMVPELAAIGEVQLKTTFDGAMADNVARLDTLNLEIAGGDGRKFAEVRSLQKITYQLTEKRVTLADPKSELARISLQSLPLAWAQAFVKPMAIDSGDLSMVLAVEAEPDGSRVRARAVEPLNVRAVTIRQGDKKLIDRVTLTTRPNIDYSATKLTAQLANLSVTMPTGDMLTGNVAVDLTNLPKNPATNFSAELHAKVVEALKPYLPVETGPLVITTTVQGRHEGSTLNLAKATANVNRENNALLTALELQQPVRADLKASTFSVPNPNQTAARVHLGEIPLAWAQPFVAKSKITGALKGGTLDVALRSVDDLTVTTAEPLVVSVVSLAMDNKPMLQNVDLLANLSATKRGEAIAYEVRKVEVKQGQAVLAGLSVTGEARLGAKMTVVAKGNLEADAATLMAQPVLAPYATLSRGKLTAVFDANLADAIDAKAVISAKNLVAKQDNRVLGDLEINLNANMKPDGSGSITAPITLTNTARKSDVAITGAFGKAANKDTFLFTGKVASSNLVVEDFQPLAALAPGGEKQPTTRTPAPSRDTKPFWSAVNGKAEVDFKRIVYGKDYIISGVRGTAVITDSKLSLDGLEGRFKENPFKVMGGITFAAQQPKPYTLTGAADVQNLDIGEILRAANPNEQPAFETKATLTARLNGTGANTTELFKGAYGKFDLTGTQGVTRLLANKGKAGTAVDVAAIGLAILGGARQSQGLTASSELIQLLKEIRFDSVKVQVERAPDLSFKLTSVEILSPIMRTTGTGTVASKSADDVANAPMNITLQLAAKGELAYALQKARLLTNQQDEKGYALMSRTFTIKGTPSKPDNTSLWGILLETGLGAIGR